jgi:UDP-2,3-diacylglucosamine pyrophosphatase LpxH
VARRVIAVVSDLHFQHTSHDALRFVQDGAVQALEVKRNVNPDAFHRFFAQIHALAEQRRTTQVELVFAGDIFELHRTPLWFFDPSGARPTDGDLGEDREDNPLRALVHRILDHVVVDNAGCWPVIARFVRTGRSLYRGQERALGAGVQVRAHYLPGNHDRLVNAWPSIRERVRSLLAIDAEDPGAPFPHRLDFPYDDQGQGYGVRIRHGHEYDAWNFPSDVRRGKALELEDAAYLRPCLGDYLTCDVATRMATCFRALYGRALRGNGARALALRRLFVALTEFDDVRPFSLLLTYMAREFGDSDRETFEALRPVIRDAIDAAERHPFVTSEARRLQISSLKRLLAGWAMKTVPFEILDAAVGLSGSAATITLDAEVPPAEIARLEPGLREGRIDTVIAGHTHLPDQVPLPGPRESRAERTREEGRFFLDSGTWRTTIRTGADGCFGRVRAFTMVFAYDHAERAADPDAAADGEGRRFESWTGHMASGSIGPALRALGPLGPARQVLRLTSVEVVRAERELDGAELSLHVGVDGEERTFRRDGVRPGVRIDLRHLAPIPLHPELDGELWLHGRELDVGAAALDPDDPLPWGLSPLPRQGDRFQEGPGTLRVSDQASDLVLCYEIVAA